MGKKKGASEKVRNRQKSRTKPKANPFEVKVNRVKHAVVNRKIQKWEKGAPGVSRSKALNKRKDTLLRELHHMKKSNTLHDKRFGENDSNLTADEKMVQRFAIERKKNASKGDFSLKDDEEVLTHYGQSLAENLQDTMGSDSDGDAEDVRTGHFQFGGFSQDPQESWKDKMNQVIADSKKHKYERQAEKEKTLEATQELDSNWKKCVSKTRPLMSLPPSKKTPSSFMMLFHNLVTEQKSIGATDKTKTEEEEAKEEAEKLEILEAERLSRMKGTTDKKGPKHVSADDLTDCFALDKPKAKLISFGADEEENIDGVEKVKKETDNFGNDIIKDKEPNGSDQGDNEEESDDDDDDESDEDDDDENDSDKFSDLASEEDSDEDNKDTKRETKKEEKKQKIIQKNDKITAGLEGSQLPFIFSAPGSFEELESLLHGHSSDEQTIIISRLRKYHHPSLDEGNKDKLESIHLYLLQYWAQLVGQSSLDLKLISSLTRHLWEMSQMFKESTAKSLQKYIIQRQSEHTALVQKRGGRGSMPKVETVLHFVLIETMFPTSDFRHPVTTPALHFMTQMLTECTPKCPSDIYLGLLLCSTVLKYISLSKRFIPEVVTFLQGMMTLACPSDTKRKDFKTFPPFKNSSKVSPLLSVETSCDTLQEQWSLTEIISKDSHELDNKEFRCYAVNTLVDMMILSVDLWTELPCLTQILQPWLAPLSALPVDNYPAKLQTKVCSLLARVQSLKLSLKVMQHASKKPVALKMFEPQIEESWSGKRKKGGPNKQVNDKQRLTHKYKREMKAAVREIKRDNEVLAKHKQDTVMQKDAERKRKMKELMHDLQVQEGDFKKMKKEKRT